MAKPYSEKFKRDAAARVREGGETRADVAKDLGVAIGSIDNWVKHYRAPRKMKAPPPVVRPEDRVVSVDNVPALVALQEARNNAWDRINHERRVVDVLTRAIEDLTQLHPGNGRSTGGRDETTLPDSPRPDAVADPGPGSDN
jgi:transposase-like protein